MKALKRIRTVLVVLAVILTAVFLAGRYGWKLGGFRACQGAGITAVEVSEKAVHITGFYPGSFPEGFCGYYSEERDGKLYVGFRFSAVFGFFETGDFDVTVPLEGEITEVVLKTKRNEPPLWHAETGFLSRPEQYGVYVRLKRSDVSLSYGGFSGGVSRADSAAMDSGESCFVDNDIMMASKDADAPVLSTMTAKGAGETAAASGAFSVDANMEKLYLTVTAEGKIIEDKDNEGYPSDPH